VQERVDVLGRGLRSPGLAGATARIIERLDRGERTFVITANPSS
jgi:hypothetical protein